MSSLQFSSITKWLKIFTYISATILLITNNNIEKVTYIIPIVMLLFLVSYSRDYYLMPQNKPIQYIWTSIVLEILLIICIGFIDKNDYNILYYFICISSVIISFPVFYCIPIVVVYMTSSILINIQRNGFISLVESIVPIIVSYSVPTVFVAVMSYIVKMQVREKQRLAHINAELEQAYKKLIDNSAVAQKLSIEQERTRMAREMHDTVAHTLTTLIVQLEACKKLAAMDPSRLPGELDKAQELSRSGFNDIKRSIKALRPQIMEDKTFLTAINSLINDTMENTKVHITFNSKLSQQLELSSHYEVAIFRVLQESITNSIRHGHAEKIEITLKQDNNQLKLFILDNGMGSSNIKKGYGMQGIRERIDSLNGSVEFSSTHGKGFQTKVIIPCEI